VTICDTDPKALERTRNDIYPSRYGKWDDQIRLCRPDQLPAESDVVIIGTPPDTHMAIAEAVLTQRPPHVLLIEKPLATPDLRGCSELLAKAGRTRTAVLVGYNHVLTPNTRHAEKLVADGVLGKPLTVTVRWLEHWGGIFGAHPWLKGPSDTYLGFSARGGGACGEHSHGINIWQHFARVLGAGPTAEVSACMQHSMEGGAAFDQVCQISLRSQKGLTGFVVQDVVTKPPVKTLRMQGDAGFIEWYANYDKANDAVVWGDGSGDAQTKLFPKKRPDDFKPEIDEVEALLAGRIRESAISLQRGIDTMTTIAAAYESDRLRRAIRLDNAKSGSPAALSPA
jgi:predicted dehydrogenase